MIIDDLDVVCVSVTPTKTNSPLIVNPNAVLTFAAAFKRLEPISGRNHHLPELRRSMQTQQFTAGDTLNVRRKLARGLSQKNALGL
jgi:hypothetical protein